MKAWIGNTQTNKCTIDLHSLTKHTFIVGATGSGKTVLAKSIVEEALAKNIKVIAFDPKGDISGLGICNKTFDFRPFHGLTERQATKLAQSYAAHEHDVQTLERLCKIKTSIYTPLSQAGKQLAFLGALTKTDDPAACELTLASLCDVAQVSFTPKVQSFLMALVQDLWKTTPTISLQQLIETVSNPPITTVGLLDLNSVISPKERITLAASLNALLSSTSKHAYFQGDPINIPKMLESDLSVIDLRACVTVQEKQFVVLTLLTNIYKTMLGWKGTEQTKLIIYIDEIAGIFPAPPATSQAKKALELLIRQARAFGVGLLLCTQNPADIDYKLLGNMGQRFIGKLRSEQDIQKVAVGLGTSQLKGDIQSLSGGQFIWHDAIQNTHTKLTTRYLMTYHAGPIDLAEIPWIQDQSLRPAVKTILKLPAPVSPKEKIVSIRKLTQPIQNTSVITVRDIKHLADNFNLKAVQQVLKQKEGPYTPYLKITVTDTSNNTYGPYTFNLISNIFYEQNPFRQAALTSSPSPTAQVLKPRVAFKGCLAQAIALAKKQMPAFVYASTLVQYQALTHAQVVAYNLSHVSLQKRRKEEHLQKKLSQALFNLQQKIQRINAIIQEKRSQLVKTKTHRFIKKLFSTRNLAKNTVYLKNLHHDIEILERKKDRLLTKKNQVQHKFAKQKKALDTTTQSMCHKYVRKVLQPKRPKLNVKMSLILS